MKNNSLYIIVFLAFISALWSGCNVAYKYDIENGFDDWTSGSSSGLDTTATIDVSMYNQARIFPGLVDTLKDKNIDTTIVLDLSKKSVNASTLGVVHVPEAIYSTGLYAGAGELIKIVVKGNVMGLTAQIGSHINDLSTLGVCSREPVVYTKKILFPGTNYLRNPLGGYLWILKNNEVTGLNVDISINGAYRAPDYVAGVTKSSEWQGKINSTTVPWLELRGEHVAFSVPTARMIAKIQEDPSFPNKLDALLQTWDYSVENYWYKFVGLTKGNNNPSFLAPDFPERVVLDIQLPSNMYMQSNHQALVVLNTVYMINELSDLLTVKSGKSLAFNTVLGRNYTLSHSPWWMIMTKAAQAIPSFRISERSFKNEGLPMSDIIYGEGKGINQLFPQALSYAAADSSKWLDKDATFTVNNSNDTLHAYALLPIVQLAHYNDNNWTFYEWLNVESRSLSGTNKDGSYFYKKLCEYFKKDFSPFFDHWGISINDDARTYGYNYPTIERSIWKYNPLSSSPKEYIGPFDTRNYHYRHNRSNWNIKALGSLYENNEETEGESGQIARTLDGDKSTYWHSIWSAVKDPLLPYYIVIDMKTINNVDGIFIANGLREHKISRMIVETTNEVDFELDNKTVKWTKITEIGKDQLGAGLKNECFYDFPSRQQCRYLRITIPDYSLANNETTLVPTVFHTLAELGTYYYKR